MSTVIFSVNTGRCGTHWIYNLIYKYYSDIYKSSHEGICVGYYSNLYYNNTSISLNKEIIDHYNNILICLKTHNYIEPGYPIYGPLPILIDKFQEQGHKVKLIHLIRNPLDWACSVATQEFFMNPFNHIQLATFLDKRSSMQYTEYHQKWDYMTTFEKLCINWLEINYYAETLKEKYNSIDWITIRMEDLFSSTETLKKLLKFIEVDYINQIHEEMNKPQGANDRVAKMFKPDLTQIKAFKELNFLTDKYNYTLDYDNDKYDKYFING